MAKFSVMTLMLWRMLEDGRLTDSVMLELLEEAGFDGVELSLERLTYKPHILPAYEEYLAWSKLEVSAIDAIGNLAAPDPVQREAAVEALCSGIDMAVRMHCPLVLSAGSMLERDGCPKEARRRVIESLRPCVAHAQAAGVTLAIENFGLAPKLLCAAADCLEVLDEVPGLGFVFDTGNFYFAGEDPEANFVRLVSHTVHVHLKDWIRTDTPELADVSCAALGTGLIPNEALLERFLSAGVESFSIEVGTGGEPLEAAVRDLRQVHAWLARV
ncbi:MAG: sugar phosphate isomerase/epimerase family protein [FCB group bacterium]|jgi:sugar phosphate isomerase/epimerase|nr:sugar phosphate isomerase/epimerase family protein [FCB group bacterium]